MSPGLAVLAIAVVCGGVIAVSSRESRVAVLGVTLAGVTAPLVAASPPDLLALAVRVVAMLLAGYLLWIALRGNPVTRGSRIGWHVEGLVATAAAVAGVGAIRLLASDVPTGALDGPAPMLVELGPREALAAGCALAALAVGPLIVGRDGLRLGIGLLLAVLAADLIRVGLASSPTALEQVLLAGLTVALAAAVATVVRLALAVGGTLEISASRGQAAGPPSAWHRRVEDQPALEGGERGPAAVGPRSGVGRRSVPGR